MDEHIWDYVNTDPFRYIQGFPATFVEAHSKKEEDDMTRYFVVDGNIIECEVPKKWTEGSYGDRYLAGFRGGIGEDDGCVSQYAAALQAEAYVAGYEAGKDATS